MKLDLTCPEVRWSHLVGQFGGEVKVYSGVHKDIMRQCGFKIVGTVIKEDKSGTRRIDLAADFVDISDEDLFTRGAHVLAIKP